MTIRLPLFLALGAALHGCGSDTADPCATPDKDGDGVESTACGGTDCDDSDPRRAARALEVCDAEGLDEDCDPSTFGERDVDGDEVTSSVCCNGTLCGTDCDDAHASVRPGAVEACDSVDNDCDSAVDEGVLVVGYTDEDGDGFGTGEGATHCAGSDNFAAVAGDCDDTLTNIHPGAFRCAEADGSAASAIEVCGADARWQSASCPDLGACVVQPDATGTCLPGSGTPQCANGLDDDGDGLADFRDPDCTSSLDDSEQPLACANELDDDADETTDFPDDPGCDSTEDDSEEDPTTPPACSNGLDDDGDGIADYFGVQGDWGCTSASDTSEREADGPSCDNGIDDDMDGKVDYPDEDACDSATGDSERPRP